MDRRSAAWMLAGVVLVLALWPRLHPPLVHTPGSDLYGNLSVARHLARGEGFLIDTVYPVSLAFPFARELPQPLIQRRPGYPVLLLLPYLAAGGDPERTLADVYRLEIAIAALVTGLLLATAARRRRVGAGLAAAVLFVGSPLAGMSVAWGRVEVPAALLLLAIWLALRRPADGGTDAAGPARAILVGAAAGLLALLRLDLFWLPWLWWLAATPRAAWRRTALFAGAWLLVLAPWAVRDWLLTGRPVFTLQAYAEHLKETRLWPGYSIYRGMAPRSLAATLVHDPGVLWPKFRSGIRFFLGGLGGWLPWTVWAAAAALAALEARARGLRCWRRPLPLALATTGLLIAQYALFSHTVRHLLVMLPVLALEIGLAAADAAARPRPASRLPSAARALLLPVAAIVLLAATPPRLPGWRLAEAEARAEAPAVAAAVAAARAAPAGPLFSDCAAVAWYADRVVVWTPLDPQVEVEIRRMLPSLADAPVIGLAPVPDAEGG